MQTLNSRIKFSVLSVLLGYDYYYRYREKPRQGFKCRESLVKRSKYNKVICLFAIFIFLHIIQLATSSQPGHVCGQSRHAAPAL